MKDLKVKKKAEEAEEDLAGDIDGFDVMASKGEVLATQDLTESIQQLDSILERELLSFDRLKNWLYVFDSYFLFDRSDFGKQLKNNEIKDETKGDWVRRKGLAGFMNSLILLVKALEAFSFHNVFGASESVNFLRNSAKMVTASGFGSISISGIIIGALCSPIMMRIIRKFAHHLLLKIGSKLTVILLKFTKHRTLNNMGMKMVDRIARQFADSNYLFQTQAGELQTLIETFMSDKEELSKDNFILLFRKVENLTERCEVDPDDVLLEDLDTCGLEISQMKDGPTGEDICVVGETQIIASFSEFD